MIVGQLLVLACLSAAVLAVPSGAPLAACGDFVPSASGHGANQAVGDNPYGINLDNFPTNSDNNPNYNAGESYTCECIHLANCTHFKWKFCSLSI